MKKLYSLFALIALLFTASGCEDDYRSMVLFEGVEPIYQIGTCDNLVSNLSYYLSETNEDTVLGIDGGDGSYNVINEHESVASVTFTDDVNGYQRIKIHPLAEGETIVKVMDGSGEETQLRITVKGRRQYTLTKMGFEYGISSGAPTELLGDVSKALAERPWVKDGGYYVLVPEDFSNSMWKGVLEIYPTGKEEEPLMGIYETVPVEDENFVNKKTDSCQEQIYERLTDGRLRLPVFVSVAHHLSVLYASFVCFECIVCLFWTNHPFPPLHCPKP